MLHSSFLLDLKDFSDKEKSEVRRGQAGPREKQVTNQRSADGDQVVAELGILK